MAEHHDARVGADAVLAIGEDATGNGRDTERAKESGRHVRDAESLGAVPAGEVDRPPGDRAHRRERAIHVVHVPEVRVRERRLVHPRSRRDSHTCTSRSGSGNGSGRSSTVRTTLKIAALAPMPNANVKTAIAVNAGLRAMRARRSAGRPGSWSFSHSRSGPVRRMGGGENGPPVSVASRSRSANVGTWRQYQRSAARRPCSVRRSA